MNVTYKFRLYPSKKQEEKLLEILELCRQTYNILLGELNNQKVIDRTQIQRIIPDIKICESKFKRLYSKTMQYECDRLFSNLRSLARSKNKRKVGRLRFKGKGWFKTFTYNQSGFKLISNGKRCQLLHLSKIGEIKIRCHRNIKGKIKQITIKKEASGKWFALVSAEQKITILKKLINGIIGIDLGLTDVVYDSEGNKVENPRHLKKHSQRLALLQRRMSKKRIGSNNRNKVRIKVARQYEKLVNTRNDFLHKLSKYYVDNFDVIGMEDLQINNMARYPYLSKSILDTSWGKLRQFVAYKAERAGKYYITVDYKGTTQRCSKCGNIVNKSLSKRLHKCSFCEFIAQRDYNSALNIKRLIIEKIGQELSEFKLVGDCVRPLMAKVDESRSSLH